MNVIKPAIKSIFSFATPAQPAKSVRGARSTFQNTSQAVIGVTGDTFRGNAPHFSGKNVHTLGRLDTFV